MAELSVDKNHVGGLAPYVVGQLQDRKMPCNVSGPCRDCRIP
jgi:hypothetical protein